MEAYELFARIATKLELPVRIDVQNGGDIYYIHFFCGECGRRFYQNTYNLRPPREDLIWYAKSNLRDMMYGLEQLPCHPVVMPSVSLGRLTEEILNEE